MRRLRVTDTDYAGAGIKAGIRIGDVLDSYDGKPLDRIQALLDVVSDTADGKHIIRLIRDSSQFELSCESGKLGIIVAETEIDEDFYQKTLENMEFEQKCNEVMLTTASHIDGYRTEIVEIVAAEAAFRLNITSYSFEGMKNSIENSKSARSVLRALRNSCLDELKREAVLIGANAVIAVDLDYTEFTGADYPAQIVIASGTAVRATKINE